MLSQVREGIKQLENRPNFGKFYQCYVCTMQDSILDNEISLDRGKLSHTESISPVILKLNNLTEELKLL